jgi:hypothetical protein
VWFDKKLTAERVINWMLVFVSFCHQTPPNRWKLCDRKKFTRQAGWMTLSEVENIFACGSMKLFTHENRFACQCYFFAFLLVMKM